MGFLLVQVRSKVGKKMLWLVWDGGTKMCSVICMETGEGRNLWKDLEYLQLPGRDGLGGMFHFDMGIICCY